MCLGLRFAVFTAMVLRWTERIVSCFKFADNPPLRLYTHFPSPGQVLKPTAYFLAASARKSDMLIAL
jgi:hypothetical protein